MNLAQPIGIFDSGIGGLTVAKAIADEMPNEQLIYFGDTLHMPYGDKKPNEILDYCHKITEFLISKNVKLIVIACNTASAIGASALRENYWKQVEILGVIRPAIELILSKKYKKIGIIGTQGTITSNIYPKIFDEKKASVEVFQMATPLLAPLIESSFENNKALSNVLNDYLKHPNFNDKEAILLACTHYPLIKKEVEKYFDFKKDILDNAVPTAKLVKKILTDKNQLSTKKNGENIFYVSQKTENFEKTTQLFYGKKLNIQEIAIF